MERYNVHVVEILTEKVVFEFEVVNGNYPNDEVAKKYGEMMWGEDSGKYRIKIDSPYTSI